MYEYVKRLGVEKKMESREDGWRVVSGGGVEGDDVFVDWVRKGRGENWG